MKDGNCKLTPSMEDYLEMIYRLSMEAGYTRINELAENLKVQPPSVTRMIQRLSLIGLVYYEKYGVVRLTEQGKKKGSILLKRHNVVEKFLRAIGVTEGIEEETEKIEHNVSNDTLLCFVDYLSFLEENPQISQWFNDYKRQNGEEV